MSASIKAVILQVVVASVYMVVVALLSIYTGPTSELPPAYSKTTIVMEGRKAFQRAGCTSCHQIMRQGGVGPDLTYVGLKWGSKDKIASVVRDPITHLGDTKSSRLMPRFTEDMLSDEKLEKIAAYLETLK